MHSLEVIVKRNAHAAGRELAHDANDRHDIPPRLGEYPQKDADNLRPFVKGFLTGREEG